MEIVHQNEKTFYFILFRSVIWVILSHLSFFIIPIFYNFAPEIKSLIIYLWNAN